jgi:hypothetical protein
MNCKGYICLHKLSTFGDDICGDNVGRFGFKSHEGCNLAWPSEEQIKVCVITFSFKCFSHFVSISVVEQGLLCRYIKSVFYCWN